MKKIAKAPSEKTVRALLAKHGCAVPFHAVRTRFLGNIATPESSASPLRIVEGLWGAELPAFESLDKANELLEALVQGLWNELTRHQKRSQPFRLARVPMEATAANLARMASSASRRSTASSKACSTARRRSTCPSAPTRPSGISASCAP